MGSLLTSAAVYGSALVVVAEAMEGGIVRLRRVVERLKGSSAVGRNRGRANVEVQGSFGLRPRAVSEPQTSLGFRPRARDGEV